MFFDGSVDIARYDRMKYPAYDKQARKMRGFFWQPDEVDTSKDKIDFNKLTESEQHIFTSNLKRQIVLDSVQGRALNSFILPHVSLPELEPLIAWWSAFETLHSDSYTHIIRGVYSSPSEVFDGIKDIEEIQECSNDISKYYDDFAEYAAYYQLLGEGVHEISTSPKANVYKRQNIVITRKELFEKLLLCLVAVNVLEGVRFYVSFACSWAFAELKKMEGNAKLIKLIARDENLHLAASTMMIKDLLKEEPWLRDSDVINKIVPMFIRAVDSEKSWGNYLFRNGSMIGLNERLLSDYIEWIATKRIRALGYESPYSPGRTNPLPWTEKWIGGSNVQVAPQETEITSYVIGGVKQDINMSTFKDMKL